MLTVSVAFVFNCFPTLRGRRGGARRRLHKLSSEADRRTALRAHRRGKRRTSPNLSQAEGIGAGDVGVTTSDVMRRRTWADKPLEVAYTAASAARTMSQRCSRQLRRGRWRLLGRTSLDDGVGPNARNQASTTC